MERHARFLLEAWERAFEDTALSERHQRRLFLVEDAPPIELKAYVAYRLHGEHRELIRELLGKLK